jgi:hypothetical protein
MIFIGGHLEQWNWFSFSNRFTFMELGAIVIGWLLAGLVMASSSNKSRLLLKLVESWPAASQRENVSPKCATMETIDF